MRGSIQRRGKNWSIMIDLPRDPQTGKRRQHRITGRTRREVESLAAQALAKIEAGGFADRGAGKLTLSEYMSRWLQGNSQTVRPSTQRRYIDLVRLHALPFIGHLRLDKVTALDIQGLYTDRLEVGKLSPTTVHQLHNILHKSLKQAVRWGLLARNPTDMVNAPRPARPAFHVWTKEQSQQFLSASEGEDLEALWRLALLTGMRRGEVLGVRWGSLDLARGLLAVTQTVIRDPAGGCTAYSTPKTQAGKRSIALPRSVIESLQKHRVRQLEHRLALGSVWQDNDLVFPNTIGEPMHPNTLALIFNKLIAKAGIPRIRFHDLRHTSATLALSAGTHPKIVQERLGHSDISMTLNRYSHVSMTMQQEAAAQLDMLVSGG